MASMTAKWPQRAACGRFAVDLPAGKVHARAGFFTRLDAAKPQDCVRRSRCPVSFGLHEARVAKDCLRASDSRNVTLRPSENG
jgi:hypothetical protein